MIARLKVVMAKTLTFNDLEGTQNLCLELYALIVVLFFIGLLCCNSDCDSSKHLQENDCSHLLYYCALHLPPLQGHSEFGQIHIFFLTKDS